MSEPNRDQKALIAQDAVVSEVRVLLRPFAPIRPSLQHFLLLQLGTGHGYRELQVNSRTERR